MLALLSRAAPAAKERGGFVPRRPLAGSAWVPDISTFEILAVHGRETRTSQCHYRTAPALPIGSRNPRAALPQRDRFGAPLPCRIPRLPPSARAGLRGAELIIWYFFLEAEPPVGGLKGLERFMLGVGRRGRCGAPAIINTFAPPSRLLRAGCPRGESRLPAWRCALACWHRCSEQPDSQYLHPPTRRTNATSASSRPMASTTIVSSACTSVIGSCMAHRRASVSPASKKSRPSRLRGTCSTTRHCY